LKNDKGSTTISIVNSFKNSTLYGKFQCSKFDANQKSFCTFKAFKPLYWVTFFFKHSFYLSNVHHSFSKLEKILTLIIKRNWGQMTSKVNIQYDVANFFSKAIILSLKASQSKCFYRNYNLVKYKIHGVAKLRIFITFSHDSKDFNCQFDATFITNH